MKIKLLITFGLANLLLSVSLAAQPRTAFVHLFEWKWNDIAQECEQHLGPKGFAAVQVSPPQESASGPEWWRRYQPISYEISTRSGNREEFRTMVERCRLAGVDIYVDAVINHMMGGTYDFPKVPYDTRNFHKCPTAIDYGNRTSIQECNLLGLHDLRTEDEDVRQKIANYMNDMISLGVRGFRIDGAKHIPSGDIAAIVNKLSDPSVYIFQEVIRAEREPVQPEEYLGNGDVTEFSFERTLGFYFKGNGPLKELRNIGSWPNWLSSSDAVVFVSNHDDQREKPISTLTYKDVGNLYLLGEVFMLAWPYGYPKVMSSYYFDTYNQGPPAQGVHNGDACFTGGWTCEHRWRGIANMVEFRNVTASEWRYTNWWDNGNNQIAFGRGGRGFIAINREDNASLQRTLQTGMPEGIYCDIINGEFDKATSQCSGNTIAVDGFGFASFDIDSLNASAIHLGAVVDTCPPGCPQGWQQAFFRGTANAWEASAMSYENGLWTTTQTFNHGDANGGPRFKIARYDDWNAQNAETYPAEDYAVQGAPGRYTITFNDITKAITVTKVGNVELVDVDFTCLNGETYFGQSVYVVGDAASLGAWMPSMGVKLGSSNYPTWEGTIALPRDLQVSWKCVKRDEANPEVGLQWESGANTIFNTGVVSESSGSF